MNSFADILKTKGTTVEAPKPIPVGSYQAVIDTNPSIDPEKGIVDFSVKLLMAKDDVDSQSLSDYGPINGATIRMTRWFVAKEPADQPRTDYGNKRFFVDTLGIDESLSFGEMIAQAPGRQLIVTIKHAPSKDGTQMYANIGQTAKA